MKIGIFETEHFEAAYPLVRLFDREENELTIFSYPASQRQLWYMLGADAQRFQWITKKEDQSKTAFIHTLYREIKKRKIELLYLNTVADNFILYAWLIRSLPQVRVIVTVHMVNNLFKTNGPFSLRKLARAAGKRSLLRSAKEFNVLAGTLAPALADKLPADKLIHQIPGAVFEEAGYRQPVFARDMPLRIAIPGSIDGRRRDYEQVFELLSLLQKEKIPVQVILLGSFYGQYGQQLLARCRQWNSVGQTLTWYETGEVNQPEFDEVLGAAHFIFTPSVLHTMISDEVEETYGITISSGNVSDTIRHARPFIIPRQLLVDANLEKSCCRYESVADILSLLIALQKEPGVYASLANAAYEASKEYTVEKIRERNRNVFGR